MAKKASPNFETSLEQLETLIHQLESGELSLEQSLQTFEKGIKLTQSCQQALKAAEQKVELLLKQNDGETKSVEFTDPESDTE